MLSRALLNCHQAAADAGCKFALEEFTSGRNRLEDVGAKAMAEVFEVSNRHWIISSMDGNGFIGTGNIGTCLDDTEWHQTHRNFNPGKSIIKKHKFTIPGS